MNYGDNLYYVNENLKLLEHSLKLEMDDTLTAEILTRQLLFVHSFLETLQEESISINGLSHYQDTLRLIMKSKQRFISFLNSLDNTREQIRKRIRLEEEEIKTMKQAHEDDITRIEAHFAERDNLKTPEDLVSQEEFRYLFGTNDSD